MLKSISLLVIVLMVMSACNNLWADVLDYKGNAITEEEIKEESGPIVGEALLVGCLTVPLYGIPGCLYGNYYGGHEREAAIRRINSYRWLQELNSRGASETEMQAAIDEAIDANMRAGWRWALVSLGVEVGSGVGFVAGYAVAEKRGEACISDPFGSCIRLEYDAQTDTTREIYGSYVPGYVGVVTLLGMTIGGVGGYFLGKHEDRSAAVRKVDIKLFQLGIQRNAAFLKYEKPPLSGARIASEILGSVGGEILGGIVGVYIGARIAGREGAGWVVGSTIGTATMVYLVGNIGNQTGSFWATLIGSILGVGVEVIASENIILLMASIAVPPIFTTIGFNLTRRYKSPPASETALINFSEGQMRLAIPTMYSQPNSFGGTLTRRVDFVKVRF